MLVVQSGEVFEKHRHAAAMWSIRLERPGR